MSFIGYGDANQMYCYFFLGSLSFVLTFTIVSFFPFLYIAPFNSFFSRIFCLLKVAEKNEDVEQETIGK
jgi:hypothetical protein